MILTLQFMADSKYGKQGEYIKVHSYFELCHKNRIWYTTSEYDESYTEAQHQKYRILHKYNVSFVTIRHLIRDICQ